MAESKLRTLIISVFCIAFLSGCSSSSNISPEIVCGKWQMYAADTGRNGKEQKQPITYTFMPDGKYVSRLSESTPEETTGKWEIKDGKLLLSETKNNIAAYTYIFFPKLFKVTFDSYFDGRKKVWIFPDYPQYIYYPTGFHPNKQNEDAGSIWSYWWNNGRRLTINIFEKKYKAFQIAKKADKDDDIKQAYIKLQNMGIIILPNLLKKIETGDTDLIPMFCYLSDQKDLKTADDCKRWWKTNKEKYKDILVESESLCTFDSD